MSATAVHRVEVRSKPGMPDPKGEAIQREAQALGVADPPELVESTNVYLIEGNLTPDQLARLSEELLVDQVTQQATIGATPPRADAFLEVHPLPGVMDPEGESVEHAIKIMLGEDVKVRTGRRFDLHGTSSDSAMVIAKRALANTVIHAIHERPYHPEAFPQGHDHNMTVGVVPMRDLDDDALVKLSREDHLFLSLEEMQAIRDEYRLLQRDPREIELETLAQTWSEHCVHKTLKATIRYEESIPENDVLQSPRIAMRGRPGHDAHDDGSVTIRNLLKSTIVQATNELMDSGIDWCLSVFVDNAGIIAFDDDHAVCFKCETHNHPSAIEPYGGAATGIGGCIRDIIGTGLAAKPIAATDIFCVAYPESWSREPHDEKKTLPTGCLHPKRVLNQIVRGVRDYGNRMGIPTLNGGVWFDDDYIGNPLVYCGCIGVMPRDKITGDPEPGDHIIALGGRTGRDGIHGATFSSAELTDTHADEFSHAVQIGNPVTEKKMLDAILEARDHESGCLYRSITDCGAGGFSSAVGEMGEKLGATVHLEKAPLKYEGLTPTEIWISEAQERMVLAVTEENIPTLQAICDVHDVELCDLGTFGTEHRDLILNYKGEEIGRLPMEFMHEGIPGTTRQATWSPPSETTAEDSSSKTSPESIGNVLLSLLAHPNIASKHWIIRQYDHEVQGGSVVKPLVGTHGQGPSDAAVILPVHGSTRGLGIANGLSTGMRDDPYVMTLAAIDECVRNLTCVGVDPEHVAILDNFCWPSCNDPRNLGSLVRAAEACYDGARAYRTPFISGKDSLNNQFTTEDGNTIQIPPTLLISGFGIVPDVRKCVTMNAKASGNLLVVVGATEGAMGGSHFAMNHPIQGETRRLPMVDLVKGPEAARSIHTLIMKGLVASAHDCSDGGLLPAAVEMAFSSDGLGLRLDFAQLPTIGSLIEYAECFAETPGRYLLEVSRDHLSQIDDVLGDLPHAIIGEFDDSGRVTLESYGLDLACDELKRAWLGTLDW
ncbi:MAG: phosphoribosylformylglycinamidine synthase subunit PurL [Planctomycetota bacterium]|nr:phosphoribosylformylglycinamidine synthase subunit PurL [Planctomycetota bacterium]